MADLNRIKKTFLDLIQINSPSGSERGVAEYVKAYLSKLGLEVEEDNAASTFGGSTGNVIAFLKGNVDGAKSIFLSSHMDTVEPTEGINLVYEGDVVSTDGKTILGSDDKAGIAAILEGITSVVESKAPHGDIQIFFDVSEEVGLCGASALSVDKIKGEYGFVFDSGKPTLSITLSAPTHANIFVDIHGTAAHAGMAPEDGISAVVAASNAISKMKLGRIDEETTANIGIISGGKARNIVPDFVSIKGEARSRHAEKLDIQVAHMKETFEKEAEKMGARADVKVECEYQSFLWCDDDPVVKFAAKACKKMGVEAVTVHGGGGSDANVFNRLGKPSVVIGVGYEGPHSHSEKVAFNDLFQSAKYCEALVATAAESGK